ncbi:MAG: gliding motility-associated C-terminal domain-containing protein [Cytophagales bacterium]|nr:gliding motility-associated C-terminal domain-containing protein [Cytophagales bacterium]
MPKVFLIISIFFFSISINYAQSEVEITPAVINSGGELVKNDQFQVHFSIGEVRTTRLKNNSNFSLTEGYIQPSLIRPQIVTSNGDSLFCKGTVINLSSLSSGTYPLTWTNNGEVVAEDTNTYSFTVNKEVNLIIAQGLYPELQADTFNIYLENVVRCPVDLIVYELITPNNDDKNDVLYIENIDKLVNYEVSLFDRWGNELFMEENYQNDYSPTNLSEGSYVYVVKDKDRNINYQGEVIIRK